MRRIFLFGFSLFLLTSCGNNEDSTASSSADSTTTEQSNAAAATTDTSTVSASNNNTTTLHGVMSNMMQQMHSMKMTEDPDHDFAMMMKHHHQGAIDMANIQISQGKNDELKQVAQKIVTDAQKDISELDAYINNHQPNSKSDFGKRSMDKMMSNSSNMSMDHSGDIDQQFATMMTMHHKEGIEMSKDYLKAGKEEQTKKVANNTIKTNSDDIKKLAKWAGNTSSNMSGHDMSTMKNDTGSKSSSDHSGH